jgi:uncharacterized membrane protein
MGGRVARPEGTEAGFSQNAGVSYSYYQETNLNLGPQLRFPPIEQVQALEANCEGFTERMVALIQQEAAHRQDLENRALDERHAIAMKDLEQEDGRIKMLILPIPFALILFAVAAIVFFALDKVVAGGAFLAAFSIPGIASLINTVRGRSSKS